MRRRSYDGLVVVQWIALISHLMISVICVGAVIIAVNIRAQPAPAVAAKAPPQPEGPEISDLVWRTRAR